MAEDEPRFFDYWSAVEPTFNSLSIHQSPRRFLAQFAKVGRPEQALFAAHWCQSEVLNGGLWQFFMNSTGVLCPEAVRAYKTIGMPLLSSVLAKAAGWFGKRYPRDLEKRRQLMSAAGWAWPCRGSPFKSETKRFLKYHEDEAGGFEDAADRFAMENCG